MAVRKIRQSWWVDFHHLGKRYRLKSPDNHRSGALTYEMTIRRQLAAGQDVTRQGMIKTMTDVPSLAEFSAQWLAEYVAVNLKPSSQRTYEQRLRLCILPSLGKMRIGDFTPWHVEKLKADMLKGGFVPGTVNKTISVFKKCLDTAVEWDHRIKVPRFKWLRELPASFRYLTVSEADALLGAVQQEPWRLMVLTALRTGMRLGEMIGLRWEDINFEQKLLSVRRSVNRGIESSPKNNRVRHIPLASDLFEELAGKRKNSGYVFLHNADRVTSSAAWNALDRAVRRARLRPIGWHVLRHSFASQLAADGVSLYMIQQLLGHSDQKMTQRYAHLSPSGLHDTVERLVELRRQLQAQMVVGL